MAENQKQGVNITSFPQAPVYKNSFFLRLIYIYIFLVRAAINILFVSSQTVFFTTSGVEFLPTIYTIMNLIYISLQFASIASHGSDSPKYLKNIGWIFLGLLSLRIVFLRAPSALSTSFFLLVVMIFDLFFTQFFMHFLNEIFPLREGKEIIPTILSIGSLSFIASGFLMKVVLASSSIGILTILAVGAFAFAQVVFISIFHFHKKNSPPLSSTQHSISNSSNVQSSGSQASNPQPEIPQPPSRPLKGLAIWLLVMTFLNLLGKYWLDFQYSKAITSAFQTPEKLAGFIAIYSSLTDATVLTLQYFLSGTVFRIIGLSKSLEILPAAVLFLSFACFFYASFIPILATQFFFTLLSKSVYIPSTSLITGVFTSKERMRVVSLIGLTAAIGSTFSSVSLMIMQKNLNLSTAFCSIGLVFFFMLFAAKKTAFNYPDELGKRLSESAKELDTEIAESLVFCSDEFQKKLVLEKFLEGDFELKKTAIEKSSLLSQPEAIEFLKKIIFSEESQNIKTIAAQCLASRYGKQGIETLLDLLKSADIQPRFKAGIIEALNEDVFDEVKELLTDSLQNPNHRISSSSAVIIVRFSHDKELISNALKKLWSLLNDHSNQLCRAAGVAGLGILENEIFLMDLSEKLFDTEKVVVENAIHFLCRYNVPQVFNLLDKFKIKCPFEELIPLLNSETSRLKLISRENAMMILDSISEDERIAARKFFSNYGDEQILESILRILSIENSSLRKLLYDFSTKCRNPLLAKIIGEAVKPGEKGTPFFDVDLFCKSVSEIEPFPSNELMELSIVAKTKEITSITRSVFSSVFEHLWEIESANLSENGEQTEKTNEIAVEALKFDLTTERRFFYNLIASQANSPQNVLEAIAKLDDSNNFSSSIAAEFLENHLDKDIYGKLSIYLKARKNPKEFFARKKS
ncbi:MAG: hypothetical protein HQM08_01060 [Candidatus Riflebacteria bacterium]|nr:hypothetical protein [Candidatus Riflebacteria bacterium]